MIGTIGNYYGCLEVKEEGGKCFWGIENWDGTQWERIPRYLYRELVRFEEGRMSEAKQETERNEA